MRTMPRRVENVDVESQILVHRERIVLSKAERQIVYPHNVGGEVENEYEPAGRTQSRLQSAARPRRCHRIRFITRANSLLSTLLSGGPAERAEARAQTVCHRSRDEIVGLT